MCFSISRQIIVAILQHHLIWFIPLERYRNWLYSYSIDMDILQTTNYQIQIEESSANSTLRGVVCP